MMACKCAEKNDIYLPMSATIKTVEPMTDMETFFKLELDAGACLGHGPGQFVEVSIPGLGEAPISVSSAPGSNGSFELVVRRAGSLTARMHAMVAGDKLGIRGPFGTTFPVTDVMKGRDVLFVCGGIGLVPVRSAIHTVLQNRADYGDVTILFGCKTPKERLFVDELESWAAREDVKFLETVDIPDSGWQGRDGVITTLIPDVDIDVDRVTAVVCGPPIMYKFVIMELKQLGVCEGDIYISLERRMKCGVGKCGHCQINGLYTCLEGPVFRYSDVSQVQEAV